VKISREPAAGQALIKKMMVVMQDVMSGIQTLNRPMQEQIE
jgi:hypothetical protein